MKNKQEVIEIIVNDYPRSGIEYFSYDQLANRAEVLIDRIAPLMAREFPESKFASMWGAVNSLDEFLFKAQRIWEGQQEPPKGTCPKCGGRKVIPDEVGHPEGTWSSCPDCKGTCPKCGGTKKVPIPKHPFIETMDCPDCDGTGRIPQSEKSKEEGFITASVTNDVPCPACGGTGIDRRSQPERRKAA